MIYKNKIYSYLSIYGTDRYLYLIQVFALTLVAIIGSSAIYTSTSLSTAFEHNLLRFIIYLLLILTTIISVFKNEFHINALIVVPLFYEIGVNIPECHSLSLLIPFQLFCELCKKITLK